MELTERITGRVAELTGEVEVLRKHYLAGLQRLPQRIQHVVRAENVIRPGGTG